MKNLFIKTAKVSAKKCTVVLILLTSTSTILNFKTTCYVFLRIANGSLNQYTAVGTASTELSLF